MSQPKCKSCGDPVKSRPTSVPDLDAKQQRRYNGLCFSHCQACAIEKATGIVAAFTLQHDAGGGQRVIRSTRGLS